VAFWTKVMVLEQLKGTNAGLLDAEQIIRCSRRTAALKKIASEPFDTLTAAGVQAWMNFCLKMPPISLIFLK